MSAQQQQKLDALYALDNVLTIRITMAQADWDAVRTEQPAGGICNFDWDGGPRYTWRKAASVEISGTAFPARAEFSDVGVKKKSFCGSINSEKPCIHLDFGKFSDTSEELAEDLFGSRYLTLNNSIQDLSYIRQPLGYRLLAMAGLPHSRCNLARVFVNGTPIGQGFPGVDAPGVYVNAEPIMKRYIERNFGNMEGNLYEIEHRDDFVAGRVRLIATESLSAFDNKADLKFAIGHIADHGIAGAADVFDLEQFIRLYAMEFFLKHWDGYSNNTNNTYVYNDVTAVEAPGAGDIKFKLIPWGIDQTLRTDHRFKLGGAAVLARLVRADAARREQLFGQIRTFRDTIFSRESQQTVLRPLLDQLQGLVSELGVPDAGVRVATVRQQLRLAGSAAYALTGIPDDTTVYLLSEEAGAALHASSSETIPHGASVPENFEVYHWPLKDDDDPADLWRITAAGGGRKSLTSQGSGRVLHASNSLTTDQGHKYLYTCVPANADRAEEFAIVPSASVPADFAYSGYFRLVSARTNLQATYGMDLTPGGRARVHQEPLGSRICLY
ncbi:CotH kinase family protein [Mycolicibacterium setense]|uniref:CotH kinase family protein n=1 Tax=Mycolicibacterium setense TaxID=431269 RepID=UPI00057532A3|nr:CotH kinase family protein [Mycolicibacterium setense]KHO18621.1 spore coat protein CotH [Mycolicibacterium setense]MCV7111288.1 CotH kinase family protein [Mycolicibacterium setense]